MLIQEAILLDELPDNILEDILSNRTNYDNVYNALLKADLSGYFQNIKSKIEQTHFATKMIINFFIIKENNNK